MAKRTHFYQKLIRKLNERLQHDQALTKAHVAPLHSIGEHEYRLSKPDEVMTEKSEDAVTISTDEAQNIMMNTLQETTTGFETQLRTLTLELSDTRAQLHACREEKQAALAHQDGILFE
jgi:hypothetical protein